MRGAVARTEQMGNEAESRRSETFGVPPGALQARRPATGAGCLHNK